MAEDPSKRDSAILRAGSLVVVNIPMTQVESEKLPNQRWWHQLMADRDVWVAETCSRVMLVTTKEHWDDDLATWFPQLTTRCMTQTSADKEKEMGLADPFTKTKPFFLKKEGWEAYTYLLEVACGLHSSDPGEDHISHQILDESYRAYKQNKHNNGTTWFEPVVAELQHDVRQVRQVIGEHIPPSMEDTARDMAELSPGGKVLVVTDRWEYAEKMLYALGRDSAKAKLNGIDVAHVTPKHDAVDRLQTQIDTMKQRNPSYPPIKAESLKDVLDMGEEWLKEYQAIILVSEFNKYPEQENKLIEAWQRCGDARPKLVAMRFDHPYEEGIMPHSELKEEAGAIVLLPDRIQETYKARMERYAALLTQGKDACGLCAQLRQESLGKHRPRNDFLALGYEGYIAAHPMEKYRSTQHTENIKQDPDAGRFRQ